MKTIILTIIALTFYDLCKIIIKIYHKKIMSKNLNKILKGSIENSTIKNWYWGDDE